MSEPAQRDSRRMTVPAPPGGHALKLPVTSTPAALSAVSSSQVDPDNLPVVEETSAGGIVLAFMDGVHHAAVIARRNRAGRLEWCLPKGHLEGEERPPQAAIREITEETGIRGHVLALLGIIDYWFTGTDRRVHKVVHHYLLAAVSGRLTVENDPDAEAEDVAWIPMPELPGRLSYPNERRIAAMAEMRLQDYDFAAHSREDLT